MKVAQSYLTLCDPEDYTVHGILQIRILEWVAFPFSRGPSQPRNLTRVSWIADGFFTNWAIREVLLRWYIFNRKLQQCNSERNVVPMKRGNTRDLGSIPGLGRSHGEGKGFPLQYSDLENSMDYIVHGVARSQTWLSYQYSFGFFIKQLTKSKLLLSIST